MGLPASNPTNNAPFSLEVGSAPEERRVGKYRILSELGRGGTGVVYLAVASGQGGVMKLVVLKALLPEFASEPGAMGMFLDEARLAAQLNHRNVVQTYEVSTEGDRNVIVMEYLEGQTLAHIMRYAESAKHELPFTMQLRILCHVLEGLHYAHDIAAYDGTLLHLVHRDVSPQNVFVTYDGTVKLLDFGIAKASSSSTHTAVGLIKGKIAYMAPEQMSGEPVDRRADIYSVGCMLWAVAAGSKLWKGCSDSQIVRNVVCGNIPSPRAVNPACCEELERITLKALAFDRRARYASALELLGDLERFLEQTGGEGKERDVGHFVSQLFSDARSQLKASIERQLAEHDTSRSSQRRILEHARHNSLSPDEVYLGSARTQDHVPLRRGRRSSWVALAVVSLAVVGSAALWVRRAQTHAAPLATYGVASHPKAAVTAGSSLSSSAAEREAARALSVTDISALPLEQRTIALRWNVTPADARVWVDDHAIESGESSLLWPADAKQHRIRFEAPGHLPLERQFAGSGPLSFEIALEELPPPPKPPPNRLRSRVRPRAAGSVPPAPVNRQCDAPFFVDAKGIKRMRAECL